MINKNSSLHIIILISILVLTLSGCSGSNKTTNVGTVDTKVLEGKTGLSITLDGASETQKVYEDTEFQFVIKIENQGASDTQAKIVDPVRDKRYIPEITFLDSEYSLNQYFTLEGLSLQKQTTDIIIIPASLKTSKLSVTEDQRTETINFNLCYSYSTNFETDVCVDTDVFGTVEREKVCTVGPKTLSKGQGAPIEVSKIELNFLSRESTVMPKIKFELKNSGTGNPLSKKTYNSFCKESANENIPEGDVGISELSFGGYTLNDFDCIPSAENMIFNNNKLELTCTLKSTVEGISKTQGNYLSKIDAKFDYYYKTANSFNIAIQKSS